MENTKIQFENSLTRQVEISMDMWTKELADISEKLINDPLVIVESLNDSRNLCTAGFLIRRQIQICFTEILDCASKETNEIYQDLTTNNNVPWPEKFLKSVCSKMERYIFKEQNEVIKATEWFQWLSDKKYPRKRELAIKISFLLKMDEYTTTKFLLACGHEPFSVRNPLDCICLFCKMLRSQGDWRKVKDILKRYEENRPQIIEEKMSKMKNTGTIGMTEVISNKIPELAGSDVPEAKLKNTEDSLIEYMYSIDSEFTRRKILIKKDKKTKEILSDNLSVYFSGYSLQRRKDLLELTRYLVKLYPTYDYWAYHEGDRRKSADEKLSNFGDKQIEVEITKDGYPDMGDLAKAFMCAHGWQFAEPSELGLPSHGKLKCRHDNIPFNREVYLVCKAYERSNRLGAIKRFVEKPDNAAIVERKDILLMAYLFISGYSRNEDENLRDELYEMAEENEDDNFSENLKNILGQLEDIVNMWGEQEKIAGYISCINAFLMMFSFETLYPPFPLDRFILYALVAEEIGIIDNLSDTWLEVGYSNMEEES
mgnify:CR=1 FL=1